MTCEPLLPNHAGNGASRCVVEEGSTKLPLTEATACPEEKGTLERFLRINRTALQAAQTYLTDREKLLAEVTPHFREVARTIGALFSGHAVRAKNAEESHELPSGLTRYLYTGLLCALPSEVQRLWFNIHQGGLVQQSPLLRVFGWAFNRMKTLDSNSGQQPCVGILRRGSANGLAAPYPVHTHVDVPYSMRCVGLGGTELSLALAASHDALEEGSALVRVQGQPALAKIDLAVLPHKFQEQSLGALLKIGIQALTESPYEEMVQHLPSVGLADYSSTSLETVARQLNDVAPPERVLEKAHIKDPLEFGGLALQVRETVRRLTYSEEHEGLCQVLDIAERRALAASIVEVEIGDRLSDIASMGHYFDKYQHEPVTGRYKVVAFISRMLNMHEKLGQAVQLLPPESQPRFNTALSALLDILAARIEAMGATLSQFGLHQIGHEEIAQFHSVLFMPIQRRADALMCGYIEQKVVRICDMG